MEETKMIPKMPLQFWMEDELHMKLKVYCAKNEMKMAGLVRKLVKEFFEKQEKKLAEE